MFPFQGLLTLCNIIADYFMLNFTQKRKIFQRVKQLDVNEHPKSIPNSLNENCDPLENDVENYEDVKIGI